VRVAPPFFGCLALAYSRKHKNAMPFVPVPNVLEVDPLYLQDGQRVENTLYFEKSSGWSPSDITDWLSQVNDLITDQLMPFLANSIQFIELIARLLDTASSIGATVPITPVVTGGVGGGSAPNSVSYAISFKTGLTGRSFRGRNYVPGLPSALISGNTVDAGWRGNIIGFYLALQEAAATNGTPWVVVSRFSGVDPVTGDPIPRATGVTTPIITVSTFDMTVDNQRRRLPGRGT